MKLLNHISQWKIRKFASHHISTLYRRQMKISRNLTRYVWRKTWHHDGDAVLYRSSEYNPARSHSTRHLCWASFSLSLSRASAGNARETHNQQQCETHKTFRSSNAGAKHTQRIFPKKYSTLIGVHERGLTWFIFIWSVERWTSSPSISSVKVIGKSRARQPRTTREGGGRTKGEKEEISHCDSSLIVIITTLPPVGCAKTCRHRSFHLCQSRGSDAFLCDASVCTRIRERTVSGLGKHFHVKQLRVRVSWDWKKSDSRSKVSIHGGSRKNRLLHAVSQFFRKRVRSEKIVDCRKKYTFANVTSGKVEKDNNFTLDWIKRKLFECCEKNTRSGKLNNWREQESLNLSWGNRRFEIRRSNGAASELQEACIGEFNSYLFWNFSSILVLHADAEKKLPKNQIHIPGHPQQVHTLDSSLVRFLFEKQIRCVHNRKSVE